jgi:hypothetical protein
MQSQLDEGGGAAWLDSPPHLCSLNRLNKSGSVNFFPHAVHSPGNFGSGGIRKALSCFSISYLATRTYIP